MSQLTSGSSFLPLGLALRGAESPKKTRAPPGKSAQQLQQLVREVARQGRRLVRADAEAASAREQLLHTLLSRAATPAETSVQLANWLTQQLEDHARLFHRQLNPALLARLEPPSSSSGPASVLGLADHSTASTDPKVARALLEQAWLQHLKPLLTTSEDLEALFEQQQLAQARWQADLHWSQRVLGMLEPGDRLRVQQCQQQCQPYLQLLDAQVHFLEGNVQRCRWEL